MFYSYNMFTKKGVNMAGYTTFINHLGEKDTFFDIYKKELQEPTLQERNEQFESDMDFLVKQTQPDSVDIDLSKLTDEQLNDYSYKAFCDVDYYENNWYDVKKESRLCSGIDNSAYVKKMVTARSNYNRAIQEVFNRINEKGSTFEWNSFVKSDVKFLFKKQENLKRVAKSKETANANQNNRLQKYIKELAKKIENKEVPDEIINLLDENGLFKERNSWGVIKKYFRLDGNPNYTPGDKMSELGKTLKNLWKNEFV